MPRAPLEQQWTTCIVSALRDIGHEAHLDEITEVASQYRGEYLEGEKVSQTVSETLQLHCAPLGKALFVRTDEPATWDLAERVPR